MTSPDAPPPNGLRSAIPLWIAAAVTLIGVALLAYMVVEEGEPGLLPLALVTGGGAWFVAAWVRGRSRRARTR